MHRLGRRPPAEVEADYYGRLAAKYTGHPWAPELARPAGVRRHRPVWTDRLGLVAELSRW